MSELKKFYITTTLPYVNAEPHIGFAQEIVAADVLARFHRQFLQETVIFNTGTDEHGQKIWQKAQEAGEDPQAYCDRYAAKFAQLKDLLNLSVDRFIRTTDPKHIKAAQEFWRRCYQNGDIYKAKYKVKYCVGCELAKTDSELMNGRCPLHPQLELEVREEENYFFRFSRFAEPLAKIYKEQPDFVLPAIRLKEVTSFVLNGLADFSISRLKSKMPWGIAVPNDDEHVMYVWFDALISYISTLDWPEEGDFGFWPGVQVAGKDNLRQQSAMWQAMLLSAGLPHSEQILINGFIGVDGQKMSKSLGNVISPQQLIDRYGIDASRFLLMQLGPFGEDMDVSWAKLDTSYNAYLANGIGNLCSRLAKLLEESKLSFKDYKPQVSQAWQEALTAMQPKAALDLCQQEISVLDKFLAEKKPWQTSGQDKEVILRQAGEKLLDLSQELAVFMPESSKKITQHFQQSQIKALSKGLFPRL